MKNIEIRQVLDTSPEDFFRRVHTNPEFSHYLYVESLGFELEPLELDLDRGRYRARIRPTTPMPGPVAKVLGVDFSFVEEGTLDPDGVYRFAIIPSRMAERIRTTGEMRVLPTADGRAERVMNIAIDVDLPAVGPMMERFLERSTRESYEQSLIITNRFLSRRAA
jgi:hypothetical protein